MEFFLNVRLKICFNIDFLLLNAIISVYRYMLLRIPQNVYSVVNEY